MENVNKDNIIKNLRKQLNKAHLCIEANQGLLDKRADRNEQLEAQVEDLTKELEQLQLQNKDSETEKSDTKRHKRGKNYTRFEDSKIFLFIFDLISKGVDIETMDLGSEATWKDCRISTGLDRSEGSLRKRWSDTLRYMGKELNRLDLAPSIKERLREVFHPDA